MSSQNNINFNIEFFPKIHISSKNIKNSRGLFIINKALQINLVKENHLSPETIINRSEINTLTPGDIITTGTVHILIAKKISKI